MAVTNDEDGNVYLTGYFSGTVDFNPGEEVLSLSSFGKKDCYVEKLDTDGNLLWVKALNENGGQDTGKAIVTDGWGNVFVAGTYDMQGTTLRRVATTSALGLSQAW